MTPETESIEIEMDEHPENKRRFHVILASAAFISSLAILFYVIGCGTLLFTSIPTNSFTVLFPALYLDLCIVAISAINYFQLNKHPFKGSWRAQKTLKATLVISAILSIISLIEITAAMSTNDAMYNTFSFALMLTTFFLVAVGWIEMFAACELQNKAGAGASTMLYAEEAMKFTILMGRVFRYFGRHYAQLLVLFFGAAVLTSILSQLIFSSLYSMLQNEEQFLITWLYQHNFVSVTVTQVDPSIAQRAQTLYYMQNLYSFLQDSFKSFFYYAALGIGTILVVNSYRGSDMLLSNALKSTRKQIGALIVISALFSLLYHGFLLLLVFPGIIFYFYCIFAYPNVLVVKEYRTVENFGKSKSLVSGFAIHTAMYVLLFYFLQLGIQFLLGYINDAVFSGMGGPVVINSLQINSYANFGSVFIINFVSNVVPAFFGPLETCLVAILFIELGARQLKKANALQQEAAKKDKTRPLNKIPYDQRVQKARYCPKCGLSVRKGITRCPNCKTEIP
ncbi:MAG TPA: zinc ribbon domain-containing protein [Candidatus Lokiarchaeia archaeon]|nr:zinc ribbon domain-containing protein [Candidatus Lokiarchaeia archaeon]